MTEAQIESHVERAMDELDLLFLSGDMRQAEYDVESATVTKWAQEQFDANDNIMRRRAALLYA